MYKLKKKILVVFGTRPEAIKFAPIIKEMQGVKNFKVIICITSQHKEMLKQVLSFFNIEPHIDLDVMQPNQNLSSLTASIITKLTPILQTIQPELVMVQGDTTTAFAGALAAFYQKIPVAHLEAGLRSNEIYSPFPEEVNRKLVSSIASIHFAPTIQSKKNLEKENIIKNVFVTGNTVVDALLIGIEILKYQNRNFNKLFPFYDSSKRMILVTGHRRESFGESFEQICNAIKELAQEFKDLQIIYPVHLNPNVQDPVTRILSEIKNVFLIPPVSYEEMILLLKNCFFVLTDSGGVQEEAPTLGKPVLVMRDVTERMEGVEAGTATLVGTRIENIVSYSKKLLLDPNFFARMSKSVNPYGDGTASNQIIQHLHKYFND